MIKKVIISPPFGNYLKLPNTTSVLGSFTVLQRKGAILQFIKTFRKINGGYINKIGLRNKGLINFQPLQKFAKHIISIAALEYDDWQKLAKILQEFKINDNFIPNAIELNLSCPNVKSSTSIDKEALTLFRDFQVILKLPPTEKSLEYIDLALSCNINIFHLCNTYPTKMGGISGTLLKSKSLHYIEVARNNLGKKIKIIGGGGMYSYQDVDDFIKSGADILSLATIALKPLQMWKLIKYINYKLP